MRGKFNIKKLCFVGIVFFMSVFSSLFSNIYSYNVSARSTTDTTSYVKVGEIFDIDSKTLNDDNFNVLLKYISGDSDVTMNDIASFANTKQNSYNFRTRFVSAGQEGDLNYSAKKSGQDIIVRLGGLDWEVVYLSKDKNGNSILTLWLDNNVQEAWVGRSATEGNYYGFVDGGLYSCFTNTYSAAQNDIYPIAMYGTSYINAVTLNNGGVYATSNIQVVSVNKNPSSAFALFTMEEYGLTNHLVTPRDVSWQEVQDMPAVLGAGAYNSNDGWQKNQSDDNFSSSSYNFTNKEYYDSWADSYLWLPSIVETGYRDSSGKTGLWDTSANQRMTFDGVSTSTTNVAIGLTSSKNGEYYSYFRTSTYCNNYRVNALKVDGSGSSAAEYVIESMYGVRPALHLNLTSISNASVKTDISDGDIVAGGNSKIYDGMDVAETLSVKLNGVTLVKNIDYMVAAFKNTIAVNEVKNVGEYTINITGKGNFRGSLSLNFTITPKNISELTYDNILDVPYTGSQITPDIHAVWSGMELIKDTDYTVTYSNNVNVGTATINLTGKGNYTGNKTLNYKIAAVNISNVELTGLVEEFIYSGEAKQQSLTAKYLGKILEFDNEFTVTYANNVNAGIASITLTGKRNFSGSKTLTYVINPVDIRSASVGTISAVTYIGNAHTPTPTITHSGKTLTNNTDYALSYINNINAGTGVVTITGKGNYSNEFTVNFTINKRNASNFTISDISSQVYTGKNIMPTVTVKDGSKTLTINQDYVVSYINNISVGTATISVTGKGNYTSDSKTKTFTITPKSISGGTISLDQTTFAYTGSPVYPIVDISLTDFVLIEGNDFDIEYRVGSATGDVVTMAYNSGTYYVVATAKGNYTGTLSTSFIISGVDISTGIVVMNSNYTYTGGNITPSVALSVNGNIVDPANYTISYSSNQRINVGEYTITLTAKNSYLGTISKKFNITPYNLSNATLNFATQDNYYTGSEVTPSITLLMGSTTIPSNNYTTTYVDNIGVTTSACVLVSAKADTNYTGSIVRYFEIKPLGLNSLSFKVDGINSTSNTVSTKYSGAAKTITDIVIKDTNDNAIGSTDYAITYYRNGVATSNFTDNGTIIFVINPKLNTTTNTTNYTGSIQGTLIINRLDLTSTATIDITSTHTYSGNAHTPIFEIYKDTNKTTKLTIASDYSYTISNNTNAGLGVISVIFEGNYYGAKTFNFSIAPKDINLCTFGSISSTYVYDGSSKTPTITVTDGSTTLIGDNSRNEDYYISYLNNTNAGTATLIVNGTNNYTGSYSINFTISPITLTIDNITIEGIVSKTYTGEPLTQELTIKQGSKTLVINTDYTIVYSSNILVGNAEIKIKGKGNYSGEVSSLFEITKANLSSANVSDIAEQIYTGNAITPTPIVSISGKELQLGEDYTISYTNNTNVTSSAVITITGKSNYTGSKTITFTIVSRNISSAIVYGLTDVTYSTLAHTPNPSIQVLGKTLVLDTDYTISYSNNIEVGSATVSFVGKGNYTGTLNKTFEIVAKELEVSMVTITASVEYNGNAQKLEPTIKYTYNGTDSVTLIKDVDYTLSYDNDITNVGRKYVTIIAKSNKYSSAIQVYYDITKRNLNNVTIADIASVTYTRNALTPSIVVTDSAISKTLVKDVDYKVVYSNNIDVGSNALVSIMGIGNYSGDNSKTFAITPATISAITLISNETTYNRQENIPFVNSVTANTLTLDSNEYVIKYYRGLAETTDFISAGEIKVVVSSNFANFQVVDEVSTTYEIKKATITSVTLATSEVTFNNTSLAPQISKVITANNIQLSASEYNISYSDNDFVNAGLITVTITSNSNNFATTSTIYTTYTIKEKPLSDNDIEAKYYFVDDNGNYIDENGAPSATKVYMSNDQKYIGQLIAPELYFGAIELINNTDYTYELTIFGRASGGLTTLGEYEIVVTGIGNYTGSINSMYKVNPAEFNSDTIEITIEGSYIYNGNAIKIDTENLKVYDKVNLKYLTYGVDFDLYSGEYEYTTGQTITVNGYYNNIKAGDATIFLIGKESYEDSIMWASFTIAPLDINSNDFTFALSSAELVYSGNEQKPTLATAKYLSTNLSINVDYALSYSNNINAGNTAKVVITGNNNFTGSKTIEFAIARQNLSNVSIINNSIATYNGNAQEITYDLFYNGMTLAEGASKDFTVSYQRNSNTTTDFTSVGQIQVIISGVGNYTGSKDFTFTINKESLHSIVLATASYTYDGTKHEPSFTVKDSHNKVVNSIYYDIQYQVLVDDIYENISTPDFINANEYNIIITGKDNYSGTLSIKYTINKVQLLNSMLSSIANQTYTGLNIEPTITITYNSNPLELNIDYTVTYQNNINAGNASIVISGIGNYVGVITSEFTINRKNIQDITYNTTSIIKSYSGSNQSLNDIDLLNALKFNGSSLVLDTDFYVTYDTSRRVNVGNYNYTINGMGNYIGSISASMSIVALAIDDEGVVADEVADQIFINDYITPQVNLILADGNITLQEAVDFLVTYEDNIEVDYDDGSIIANAKIIIFGKGNYSGTRTIIFKIIPREITSSDITIEDILFQEYTGNQIAPRPEIKYLDYTLAENLDFNYSYGENINIGLGTVTITGIGNFSGSVVKGFDIALNRIDSAEVSGYELQIVYTGNEQKQVPNVKFNEVSLEYLVDFDLEYPSDMTNVGVKTITIRGINNYSGNIVFEYEIISKVLTIADIEIEISGSTEYTGLEVLPQILIKNDNTLLNSDDYTISITNNINVGIANIAIVFRTNYSGFVQSTFAISKATLTSSMINGIDSCQFTGLEIKPTPVIVFNGNTIDVSNFTLSYASNVNIGSATITIRAKDNCNFTGSVAINYDITQRIITNINDLIVGFYDSTASYVYNTLAHNPAITSVKYNDYTLTANDYDLSYGANINAGIGKIYFALKGNFDGNVEYSFEIQKRNISEVSKGTIANIQFDGLEHKELPVLTYNSLTLTTQDYSFTYTIGNEETSNFVDVNTIVINIVGLGNFTGTTSLHYRITPRQISDSNIIVNSVPDQEYKGSQIKPSVTISYNGDYLTNDSFSLEYGANIDVSTGGTIQITGIGNFIGTKTITFNITPRTLILDMLLDIDAQQFTGNAICPQVMLKDGDNLISNNNYDLQYINNINIGQEAKVTITGKNNYKGTIIGLFSITQANINSVSVSALSSEYTYNNQEIKPNISLTLSGYNLVESVDYTTTYSDNCIDVGEKQIVITGIGNFVGTKTIAYIINPLSITNNNISIEGLIAEKTYNTQPHTQSLTIKYLGNIVSSINYNISYSNNTNAGTAIITITGKNNYKDFKEITFVINKYTPNITVQAPNNRYYENDVIPEMIVMGDNIVGSITFAEQKLLSGSNTYHWNFVPNDTTNYNNVNGTVIISAEQLVVVDFYISGNYKKGYNAFDVLSLTGLEVYVKYNSGTEKKLNSSEYSCSIANGIKLNVDDEIVISTTLFPNKTIKLEDITISPIEVTVAFLNYSNLLDKDELQYITIAFSNSNIGDDYLVDYSNTTNSQEENAISKYGHYIVTVHISNNNFILVGDNSVEFDVKKTTLSSNNSLISATSSTGFDVNNELKVEQYNSLDTLNLSAEGFALAYRVQVLNNGNIQEYSNYFKLKINAEGLNTTNLIIYKLVNNSLVKTTFELDNNFIIIDSNGNDVFVICNEQKSSNVLMLFIIVVFSACVIAIIILAFAKSVKKKTIEEIKEQGLYKEPEIVPEIIVRKKEPEFKAEHDIKTFIIRDTNDAIDEAKKDMSKIKSTYQELLKKNNAVPIEEPKEEDPYANYSKPFTIEDNKDEE